MIDVMFASYPLIYELSKVGYTNVTSLYEHALVPYADNNNEITSMIDVLCCNKLTYC